MTARSCSRENKLQYVKPDPDLTEVIQRILAINPELSRWITPEPLGE
jgi:hypothetical protein